MTKTIYIGLTGDLFHDGHKELILDAHKLWDSNIKIIVAVNSDEFVKFFKLKTPINNENERLYDVNKYLFELLEAGLITDYTTFIMPNHDAQKALLDSIRPDFILHGTGWDGVNKEFNRTIYEQYGVTPEWCEDKGILFVYTDRRSGVSTTKLREEMKE